MNYQILSKLSRHCNTIIRYHFFNFLMFTFICSHFNFKFAGLLQTKLTIYATFWLRKTYKESGQAYGNAKSEHSFKLFTHFYELHVSGTLLKLLHMNAISIHSDNYVSVNWYDKLVSIQQTA